jgi:alpha-tubulin suppressor-like RCC1 family protein
MENTTAQINSGNLAVSGDLTMTGGSGGTASIMFVNSIDQQVTVTGGTWPSGLIQIIKPAGKVTLLSAVNLAGTGQDLTVTSGKLVVGPAASLAVQDTLSIAAAAKLIKQCRAVTYGTLANSGTIIDGKEVVISVNDDNQPEGINHEFIVSLDQPNCLDTVFDFNTSNGTAMAGSDYTSVSGTVTIAAGTPNHTLPVTTTDDTLDETTTEYFDMLLYNLSAGVIPGDITGVGTIQDNDAMPTISINNASLVEGANANLTVSLSAPSGLNVVFDWATSNGSAVSGSDYTVAGQTSVTILAGQPSIALPGIPTTADGAGESTEAFTVELSNLNNATAGSITGVVTLFDIGAPLNLGAITTLNSPTSSTVVTVISFAGDNNNDSAVVICYCNQTDAGAGCDPEAAMCTSMTRSVSDFTKNITGLTSPDDPGDTLKVRILGSDPQGVTGSPVSDTVTLSAGAIQIAPLTPSIFSTDSDSFEVQALYSGDSNNNASSIVYYCNETQSPGCIPNINGTSLSDSGTSYDNLISNLNSNHGYNPGDVLNVRVVFSDPDGVSGSATWNDTVTILPIAELDNAPYGATTADNLNVVVSGNRVEKYMYKLGSAPATDCTNLSGYSGQISAANWITDSLTVFGTESLKLCVLGLTAAVQMQQSELQATAVVFQRDATGSMSTFAFDASSHSYDFEANRTATVTFTLTSGTPRPYPVVLQYKISGNAVAGSDYITPAGTVTIPSNTSSAGASISLLEDITSEPNSHLKLHLVGADSDAVTIGEQDMARIDILDDDSGRPTPTAISMGAAATSTWACAIYSDQKLRCWGKNIYGLGSGTTDSPIPVVVDGGSNYQHVSVGHLHACAITTANELKCWGFNSTGQIGDGGTIAKSTPYHVDAGVTYSDVSTSLNTSGSTCAVTTTGVLKCWGNSPSGQLGDNSTTQRNSPVVVDSGVSYVTVAFGSSHACGITSGGELKCWGTNTSGRLGDGTQTQRLTPVTINSGTSYLRVSAHTNHTCGITTSGTAQCWGQNNDGQLGDNSVNQSLIPVNVNDGSTYTEISAGVTHTCGRTNSGDLKCWGRNDYHQLGLGDTTFRLSPTLVGSNYLKVYARDQNTCAMTNSSFIQCWGKNSAANSKMGDGTAFNRVIGMRIDPGVRYKQIAVGHGHHACAITNAGVLKCWGENGNYQLGDGTNIPRPRPVVVTPGQTYKHVAVGNAFTCAIAQTDDLYCWGQNNIGQLGDGTGVQKQTPTLINSFGTAKAISLGVGHACAIATTDQLYCWGWNASGHVGDNTTADKPSPVAITTGGMNSTRQVSAGYNYTCAINSANQLYCWGDNVNRTIGDGTGTNRWLPTVTSGAYGTPLMVSAGSTSTCMINTSNQLYCWGRNTGDNTVTMQSAPVLVGGGTYAYVASGNLGSCAITTGGDTKCWGVGTDGQHGYGLKNSIPALPLICYQP